MNLISQKIREFFPLFLEIRIRIKNVSLVFQIISMIIVFVQMSLVAFFSLRPSTMVGLDAVNTPESNFLNAFLIIPWFFDDKFCCFDTSFALLLQIFWFAITINAKHRCEKRKTLRNFHLMIIFYIEKSLTGIFAIPLYFRFALVVDSLIQSYSTFYVIATILSAISVFFNIIIGFWNSVFVEPFDLIERSPFDLYEGKSRWVYHVHLFIFVVFSFLIFTWESQIAKYIMVVIMLTIAIFDIYIRILPYTYVSVIVKFLDNSVIVVIPMLITTRVIASISTFNLFFVYLGTLLLFLLLLVVSNYYLKEKANQVMSAFASSSGNEQVFIGSGFSPFNFVSLLRMCVRTNPSPEIFERLIEMQRTFNRRGSNLIEICRFLGVFPSRRAEMIDEIDITTSNSLHNQFIIYCIRARLQSLVNLSSPDERKSLGRFRRQFVEATKRYWTARLDGSSWKAMAEWLNICLLSDEMLGEAPALLRRFPFDPKVRRLYIECLYLSGGDAMEIQNQQNILNEIIENPTHITDPILHSAIKTIPHVMRFLTRDEIKICSSSTTMRIKKSQKQERPVWSYLAMKPRQYIPGFFLIYAFPVIAFIAFCGRIILLENNASALSSNTKDLTNEAVFDFSLAAAGMFIPFSIEDTSNTVNWNISNTNESECQVFLFDCIMHLIKYYSNLGRIRSVVTFTMPVITTFFNEVMNTTDSYCGLVNALVSDSTKFTVLSLNSTRGALQQVSNIIQKQKKVFTTKIHFISFAFEMLILCIIASVIFIILIYYRSNHILNEYKEYFEYLASDERYELLMDGKGEEAWELLRSYIQIHSSEDPSIPVIPPMQVQQPTLETLVANSRLSISKESSQASLKSVAENDISIDPLTEPLKPSRGYLLMLISVLMSWSIIVAWMLYLGISHTFRSNKQNKLLAKMELTFELTKTTLFLQKEISNRILGGDVNSSKILDLSTFIENATHIISKKYLNNITDSEDEVIGSLKDFVHILANNYTSYDQEFWQLVFLPQFFEYTTNCIINGPLHESKNVLPFTESMIVSFIFIMFFASTSVIVFGIQASLVASKEFDTNFLFPVRLIELCSYVPDAPNDEEDKFPDNALIVRSVSETGQIYSVSQNSILLLGKKSETLIDSPFNEVFSPVLDEVPLVSAVDKKQDTKTFLMQKKQQGRIVLSVLVDDSTKVMNGSTKEVSAASQLVGYVPNYFSERFTRENNSKMYINKSHFLILKLKDSEPKLIERFYGNFSMMINHFSRLRCIHMDGSLISCLIDSELNTDEVIFMTREVIHKIGDYIDTMSLVYFDHVEFNLIVDDEPYIECDTQSYKDSENRVFSQEPDTISFTKSLNSANWSSPKEWENLYILPIRQFWLSSIKVLSK